jgi:hypothetical protein
MRLQIGAGKKKKKMATNQYKEVYKQEEILVESNYRRSLSTLYEMNLSASQQLYNLLYVHQ